MQWLDWYIKTYEYAKKYTMNLSVSIQYIDKDLAGFE